MEDNGTYRWAGNQPQKPVNKPDWNQIKRTATMVVMMLILVAFAGTCFYTVDDKQQAVFVTFAAAEVCRPKERMFIAFDKSGERRTSVNRKNLGYEITLTSQNIGRQPQKQYFDRNSNDESEQNDARLFS